MAREFKNLKFGVNIHTGIQPGVDPVTEALHAEQLGFDVVTIHGDVLHGSARDVAGQLAAMVRHGFTFLNMWPVDRDTVRQQVASF
jgi:hypothetical protein